MECPECSAEVLDGSADCPHCRRNLWNVRTRGAFRKLPMALFSGGGIGLVALLLCGGLLGFQLIPALLRGNEAEHRAECQSKLRLIALALLNYQDHYGVFPPAVTYSADGQPMHSWRVLILPYVENSPMYHSYRMNEPWNSPGNLAITARMPDFYDCPSNSQGRETGETHYLALDGPGSALNSREPVRVEDLVDGPSQTLMVVEARHSGVHWTKPRDIDIRQPHSAAPDGLSSFHFGGFQAALADGTVRFIPENIDPQNLKAWMTINGGETVGDF